MPHKLRGLIVNRVALVDAGANPEADIVLFKREKQPVAKATFDEVLEAERFYDVVGEVCRMTYTLQDAIWSSLYADGDRAAEIKTSVKQFSGAVDAALESWLKGQPVTKADLQDVLSAVQERITKLKENKDMKIDVTKLSDAEKIELRKALGVEEPAPAPEAKPAAEETLTEEVVKALPENVRKALEASEKIAKDAMAKAAQAEEQAKAAEKTAQAEVEKRENAELLALAKTEFAHLPGNDDEKVAALKAAKGNEALMKMLRSGDKAMEVSLMQERGSDTRATTGSAWSKIEKLAKDKVDAKLATNFAKAVSMVAAEQPSLYRQYQDEQRGR